MPLSTGPRSEAQALLSVPRAFSDQRTSLQPLGQVPTPHSRPWPGSGRQSPHTVHTQMVRVASLAHTLSCS